MSTSTQRTQFLRPAGRRTDFNCLSKKIVPTMGFQTKYPPSFTVPDQSTPLESDSKPVTSTILTKNQLKRSKNAQVRLVNNNNEYHLVSSSSNTQSKIMTDTTAPPHPSRYPHVFPPKDSLGHYDEEENDPPVFKFPVNKITKTQPQQPKMPPHTNIEINMTLTR